MVDDYEHRTRTAVSALRTALLDCVSSPSINDLAFIGNSSDVYEWAPSRIVDVDCFLFATEYGSAAGEVVQAAQRSAQHQIERLGVDFELRVIKGAYKPDRAPDQPPIVCAHLGLFDDARYSEQPALQRWAWKKYRCSVEPGRLARLAPPRPTLDHLVNGPRGVRERLEDLNRRSTTMTEYLLPDLEEVRHEYTEGTPQFVEFCYASAASCARHHVRVLGHAEADTLGNDDFFPWYRATILASEALQELIRLKANSRNNGFSGLGTQPRELACNYLETLLALPL